MVSLVLEAVVLLMRLANSGTGLNERKVAELAIIMLQELNSPRLPTMTFLGHPTHKDNLDSVGPKTLSDLVTLCAEVEQGDSFNQKNKFAMIFQLSS